MNESTKTNSVMNEIETPFKTDERLRISYRKRSKSLSCVVFRVRHTRNISFECHAYFDNKHMLLINSDNEKRQHLPMIQSDFNVVKNILKSVAKSNRLTFRFCNSESDFKNVFVNPNKLKNVFDNNQFISMSKNLKNRPLKKRYDDDKLNEILSKSDTIDKILDDVEKSDSIPEPQRSNTILA